MGDGCRGLRLGQIAWKQAIGLAHGAIHYCWIISVGVHSHTYLPFVWR